MRHAAPDQGVTEMLHVLIVEDLHDLSATWALLLRMYGHEVDVAGDGLSALHAVRANPPDVVLLDIGLPKIDGWQLAQQIRQESRGAVPLLIAMTGYGTDADKRRSHEAGIDIHLVKPVEPAVIEDLLARFQQGTADRSSRAALL
jgi:CheY-like chemotaxis protein